MKINRLVRGILWFLLIVILSYSFILFFQWQTTLFHEAGHLKVCKTLNISCQPNLKSFSKYISFINYNLLKGNSQFATMNIEPNLTQFCSLTAQQQQLIRIGGFRNDLTIAFVLVSLLVIEFIFFSWFIYTKKIKQRRLLSIRILLLFIFIFLITLLALYSNLMQLTDYFFKNLGDLFYFPCH